MRLIKLRFTIGKEIHSIIAMEVTIARKANLFRDNSRTICLQLYIVHSAPPTSDVYNDDITILDTYVAAYVAYIVQDTINGHFSYQRDDSGEFQIGSHTVKALSGRGN